MQKRVIKKRGVIFSRNAERLPGLEIFLPMGISAATKKRAQKLAQTELQLRKKQNAQNAQQPALVRMAEQEKMLAKLIKGRELIIARKPFKQSRLVFTSKDGRRVKIKHISGGGKVEEIRDIGKFAYYLELAASKAKTN